MSAASPLRDDLDGPALRALARTSKDANQTRRLLSLAVIYESRNRSEAAAFGGVGLQIRRPCQTGLKGRIRAEFF
jgi:putative transposase